MDEEEPLDQYGDPGIASAHAPIPLWLKIIYIFTSLWAIVWFLLYFNGSWGWLDRGYWGELQKAAMTTFPSLEENKPQFEQK